MRKIVINDIIIYRLDIGNKHAQMAFSFKHLRDLQEALGTKFETYIEERLIKEIWNLTLKDYEQPDN